MSLGAAQTNPRAFATFAAERPGAVLAGGLLALVAVAALFAPLIAPQDPFDLASFDILDSELPPIWQEGSDPRFLLGTDAQGRDLFSAILYGTRISLQVGILAVVIQAAIGIALGLLAGYFGGRVDSLVTRLADIQLSLSTLMMAIIVMALVRAGLGSEALTHYAVPLLVLVIGLAEWPIFARTARAATLVETAKDYVPRRARCGDPRRGNCAAPHPPQHLVAAGGHRHHPSGRCHHGGGGLVISRARHARHPALTRHADPLRL